MAQAFYNIVTTLKSTSGETSRQTAPIGMLEQNGMLDITLAFCILDYSTGLMRELKNKGYVIAEIEDQPCSGFRKITLSNGSTITISTDANETSKTA